MNAFISLMSSPESASSGKTIPAYRRCQSCSVSYPPTTTIAGGNASASSALSPVTCAAGWSRSAPSGRNALQHQSDRRAFSTGATPSSARSDSVRSSPLKHGCMSITPARWTTGLSVVVVVVVAVAVHRWATWCAMLPPALSPTTKQVETSTGPTWSGRPVAPR
uniref:Uncharacterized protein n=1 Tax=Oryza glumipatula TaxID=40148 RepID=A0A0E0ANF7_9ORYZ